MQFKGFFAFLSSFRKKESRQIKFEDIPADVIKQIEDRWYRTLDFQRLYQPVTEPIQWLPLTTLILVVVSIIVAYVR